MTDAPPRHHPGKDEHMTERIVGHEQMAAALCERGYPANVERTGWGLMTVSVMFAEEVALVASDGWRATGEWVWWLEDANGPLTGRSSPAVDGWALLDVVGREQDRHGGQFWAQEGD